MITRLLNALVLDLYQKFVFRKLRRGSIQAVKGYLQGVRALRLAVIGGFGLGATAALIVTGLVLAIMGTIALFPVNSQAIAITAVLLGLTMALVPAVIFAALLRERKWLEASKAYELMDVALAPWVGGMPPDFSHLFSSAEQAFSPVSSRVRADDTVVGYDGAAQSVETAAFTGPAMGGPGFDENEDGSTDQTRRDRSVHHGTGDPALA